MLTHFTKDLRRDLLYPDVQCYQMDLSNLINDAIEQGIVDGDMRELPSWQKYIANPLKAKGFFTGLLKAVFLGEGGYDELNIDYQTFTNNFSNTGERKRRVSMMFLPDNTRTSKDFPALSIICSQAREALPGYEIVELSGKVTSNYKAEKLVKEVIKKNPDKNILIIASKIGQRSFSVGEIDEVYLAYDKGENGSTIQKISRALTPNDITKVGSIISLSFDPNRDDKLDHIVIQTASNLVNRSPEQTDIVTQLQSVLRTIPIFTATREGSVRIDVDTFVEEALQRNSISRIIGKIVDITEMSPDTLHALANGNIGYLTNSQREAAPLGRTRDSSSRNSTNSSGNTSGIEERDIQRVREMLVTIVENADIILFGTGTRDIKNAISEVSKQGLQEVVEQEFNIPFQVIEYVFQNNFIKQDWIDLLYSKK